MTSYRAIINSPECPVPYSTTIPTPKIHHPSLFLSGGLSTPPAAQPEVSIRLAVVGLSRLFSPTSTLSGSQMCWRGFGAVAHPIPESAERPYHASLLWCPLALRPEVERMIQWGVLTRQPPILVNPCVSVVKDSDVVEQCRVADARRPSTSTSWN